MKKISNKKVRQIFLKVKTCQCGNCIYCGIKKQLQPVENIEKWLNHPPDKKEINCLI